VAQSEIFAFVPMNVLAPTQFEIVSKGLQFKVELFAKAGMSPTNSSKAVMGLSVSTTRLPGPLLFWCLAKISLIRAGLIGFLS
jgi:hypothetical protein